MKSPSRKDSSVPSRGLPRSAKASSLISLRAFRALRREMLALYFGSWPELVRKPYALIRTGNPPATQGALSRRLQRDAAIAANRGDLGARDFLTDLLHEQAA